MSLMTLRYSSKNKPGCIPSSPTLRCMRSTISPPCSAGWSGRQPGGLPSWRVVDFGAVLEPITRSRSRAAVERVRILGPRGTSRARAPKSLANAARSFDRDRAERGRTAERHGAWRNRAALMDSRPPRMGSPAAVRNATSACPLPRRFVQSQVEELCEGDVKLKSLSTQRVADKFAEAILTSFRLELSLPPYLAAPSRPLDSELRRQLQGMRAAFPVLLGGRSDELLVAWYDREELVSWLVPPSQPRPTSVPQEAPTAAHAELSTKRRGGASPKRRPSRSRFPRSESPKGRSADPASASSVVADVAATSSVAPPPPAASTSCPLPPTPASVASAVAPSAPAHPTAAATAAAATTAAAAAPAKLRTAAAPALSAQKLGAWARGEALPRNWPRKPAAPPPAELASDRRPAAPPRHATSSRAPSCPRCATAAASSAASAAGAIAAPLAPRGPSRPTPGLTRLQALAYSPRHDAAPLPPLPPLPLRPALPLEAGAEEGGGSDAPSEARRAEAREAAAVAAAASEPIDSPAGAPRAAAVEGAGTSASTPATPTQSGMASEANAVPEAAPAVAVAAAGGGASVQRRLPRGLSLHTRDPFARSTSVELLAAGRPVVFDASGAVRSAEEKATAERAKRLLAAAEAAGAAVAARLLAEGAEAAAAAVAAAE
eukprot:scaffold23275_cov64-Phaeocystis_antarctica.AAC.1